MDDIRIRSGQAKPDAWFKRYGRCEDARRRLFCFHHAGGGPSLFRTWQQSCPDGTEVVAVASPGREARLGERPFDDMDEYVDSLLAVLPTDKPFAFFGHSLGAMISFELARKLHEKGMPLPAHLFLSACPAPQCIPEPGTEPPLSDQGLLADIASLGGTPREVLQSPELLGMLLPMLRADYRLMDNYVVAPGCDVRLAITAYGGTADASVPLDDIRAWEYWSEGDYVLRTFDGDHFYLKEHQEVLIRDIFRRWPDAHRAAPTQRVAPDGNASLAAR